MLGISKVGKRIKAEQRRRICLFLVVLLAAGIISYLIEKEFYKNFRETTAAFAVVLYCMSYALFLKKS